VIGFLLAAAHITTCLSYNIYIYIYIYILSLSSAHIHTEGG
jgi:hypothetical protein